MFDVSEPIVQLLGIGLTSSASASFSGDSDVSASVTYVAVESVSLSGESDVSASAVFVADAVAGLDFESTVSASAVNELVAAADLDFESSLTAAATVTLGISLSADSDLSAAAVLVNPVDSSLSSESSVSASATLGAAASASLSAEFTLSGDGNLVNVAAALANGGSELTATAVRAQPATARNMPLEVVGRFTALVGHPVQGRPIVASSAVTATIYTNPRLLVLPTVEYAYTDNVLLERYPIDNGRSLLITAGVGEVGDFFAQEQIRLADYYFGGGRRHELTTDEEAAVVAAGYGDLIVTEFL